MKKLFAFLAVCFLIVSVNGQEPASAKPGIVYGAPVTAEGSIDVSQLEKNIKNNLFQGKITGTVVEVCQEKGCWMKLDNGSGEKLMVKFKDYGFFMPKDIKGKKVVLEGEAKVNRVSVKQLQHYAKDAGKSEEEIKAITKPKREIQFIADGVLVAE